MNDITEFIPKGVNIAYAAQMAINEASKTKKRVRFTFNDIILEAHPLSYNGDILEIYFLKDQLRKLE